MIHLAELLKVREITIDTMQHKDFATKEEELKVMRFYQNDLNSAKLLINVTHDKVVTDFSTATKVQIAFLKPDGKRVFQDVQNVNQMQGKYYVVLSTQTLIAYGNVVAQLRLTFPDNKVIETCKFVFAVDESIMSDEAMKSTNEFPVIQKAIEAGEKLEGVDINGIIAAGAKADAALPKSGGTMTGNVDMDVSVGSKSKGYRWRDATGALFGLEYATDGALILYDYKNSARVWQYDPVAKRLTVLSDTNLLKTTGGTITGSLALNNELRFEGATSVQQMLFKGDGTTTKSVWLAKSQEGIVVIPETAPGSGSRDWANAVYLGGNQNGLVKKTGDAMTGKLVMDKAQPIDFNDKDGNRKSNIGIDSNGRFYSWDEAGGKYFWVKNADGTFTVNADNLVKKTGDTITGTQKMGTNAIIQQEQHKRNANAKGIFYTDEGSATTVAGVGRYVNDTGEDFMYMGHGSSPWNSTAGLRVSPTFLTYKGKDVKTADKDGISNITLTADAELTGANGVIAVRRGNTVSLRAPIRRKAGSGNLAVLFTLPADMRPVGFTVQQGIVSIDGVSAIFTVSTAGEVTIQNATATDVAGKNFFVTCTYVTD
ncbi:BppU family phage baseplate upper protein [Bacillus paranthracis]|uniref:BppU family phage baseplate upper protein n=2 Tax=Bacteria TaxID=2 RepID=UPI003D648D70